MKILHTSDLHLNSKMTSRLGAAKAREQARELVLNFKEMTDFAEREGCRAFIIAGDLFDTDSISEAVKKSALDIIAAKPEITFFYLPGNHERLALANGGVLPENLRIFQQGWTYFTKDGVRFAGRWETEPDMFKTLEDKGDSEALVCVLHGELRDRSDFGGVIGKRDAEFSSPDYLALGHYHSFSCEEFGKNRFAVYPGTPLGRGFDECGECGFVIIDTDGENVKFNFQKTHKRQILIKDVELDGVSGTHELWDKISHACRDIPKSTILRVRLCGERTPEAKLDIEFVENAMKNSFYHFEIKDASRLKIRYEDYINDKTLKGEFIRLVLSDTKLSENEKTGVILAGISALMGESV